MNLIDFPKSKNKDLTWAEAMLEMIDNADDNTKNRLVKNLLIISEDDHDYSFGLKHNDRVRQMLGTMECVKAYFIMAMHEQSDYEYPE